MKQIKKFEYFSKENVDKFDIAFEKYIKNQKIVEEYNQYPSGILCENGYKYVSIKSGDIDNFYNETYILDNNDNIVAYKDW